MVKGKNDCCAGGSRSDCCCCSSIDNIAGEGRRQIKIEFMYLDLSLCDRCKGTEAALAAAVRDVAQVLEAASYEVLVENIHVTTEEQAKALSFVSSPTIRINGQDIQLEVRETLCESCSDLCGEDVDCRVWVWQGKEYTVPPKAMIVDAILRHVYGPKQDGLMKERHQDVPLNLKRFFKAVGKKCNC